MAPPPVSPVLGVSLAVPADIASQQQDAPNELYLTPPAQNAPHAILPDVKPVTVPTETVAARETPATADVTELPSAVENPSPDAPKDEFVMIISAASLRDGPSATARLIGRAYAGARARVASRDSGWAQIVDPASGHSGWVNSSVLVPSATTETAATENPSGGPTEGALDHSLEDGSAPTAKSAQSIRTSKHAAKRKRHKASHVYYGRPRLEITKMIVVVHACTSICVPVRGQALSGDHLDFRASLLGQSTTGSVDVGEDHVRLEVQLPWLLSMLANKAKALVEKQSKLMLEKPVQPSY